MDRGVGGAGDDVWPPFRAGASSSPSPGTCAVAWPGPSGELPGGLDVGLCGGAGHCARALADMGRGLKRGVPAMAAGGGANGPVMGPLAEVVGAGTGGSAAVGGGVGAGTEAAWTEAGTAVEGALGVS